VDFEEVENLGVAYCPEVELIASRPIITHTKCTVSTNITPCIIITRLDMHFIVSILPSAVKSHRNNSCTSHLLVPTNTTRTSQHITGTDILLVPDQPLMNSSDQVQTYRPQFDTPRQLMSISSKHPRHWLQSPTLCGYHTSAEFGKGNFDHDMPCGVSPC
jgi:hypothetical protein